MPPDMWPLVVSVHGGRPPPGSPGGDQPGEPSHIGSGVVSGPGMARYDPHVHVVAIDTDTEVDTRWLKPLTTEVAQHLLIPVAYAPVIIACGRLYAYYISYFAMDQAFYQSSRCGQRSKVMCSHMATIDRLEPLPGSTASPRPSPFLPDVFAVRPRSNIFESIICVRAVARQRARCSRCHPAFHAV